MSRVNVVLLIPSTSFLRLKASIRSAIHRPEAYKIMQIPDMPVRGLAHWQEVMTRNQLFTAPRIAVVVKYVEGGLKFITGSSRQTYHYQWVSRIYLSIWIWPWLVVFLSLMVKRCLLVLKPWFCSTGAKKPSTEERRPSTWNDGENTDALFHRSHLVYSLKKHPLSSGPGSPEEKRTWLQVWFCPFIRVCRRYDQSM